MSALDKFLATMTWDDLVIFILCLLVGYLLGRK